MFQKAVSEVSTLAFPSDMRILSHLEKDRDEGKLSEALAWGANRREGVPKPQKSRQVLP